MTRTELINILIKKTNAKKYLEIGIASGENFQNIDCEYKIGVDPLFECPATHYMTSDEFFSLNTDTFDVIFIDGMHLEEYLYRDITNSLTILNDGGYIICHDINPSEEYMQERAPNYDDTRHEWTGDCWKAFVRLRSENPNLEMYTVDTDYGCGVICKSDEHPTLQINLNELTWENFENNKSEWINLITIDEFYGKHSL